MQTSAHGLFEKEAKRLRVITTSEMRTFRRCPREHHYAYRLLVRPIKRAEPLRFGVLMHEGQEAWWHTVSLPDAYAAIRAKRTRDTDEYELAKADALMAGYHHRWKDAELEVLAVEVPFECDLINPLTGAKSQTFRFGGKIDAVVRVLATGRIAVVEHKTSSADVDPGSNYWRNLRVDAQVSNYLIGARSIGFDAQDCLYDVIRKPGLRPQLATPHDEREYTKPRTKQCPECKKKKPATDAPHTITTDAGEVQCVDGLVLTYRGGELYAKQREHDESPDDYRRRILADIGAAPEKYFIRGDVVRLERDRDEAAYDLWSTARAMREAELAKRAPRNPDACFRYGRPCSYFAVCCGETTIDDATLFRVADTAHEELSEEKAA